MNPKRGAGESHPKDFGLWENVAKTVKPLQRKRPAPKEKTGAPAAAAAMQDRGPVRAQKPSPVGPPLREIRRPPLAPLDRRTRGRVARGHIEIDDRLDLHGLTIERAHARLVAFLRQAQSRGHRLVLVITGKGSSGRGALRHEVPHWLALAELRALVIGFEEAEPRHGGAGALYVRVRRNRD